MSEEFSDFTSGYSQAFAPALTGAYAQGLTGATAFSSAFAAVGPIGVALGVLSAISGRRKRKRARRAAARKLEQQRVEARGQARGLGRHGQQQVGGVMAAAQSFGGTVGAGLAQATMGNIFLEQQRVMQRVGLSTRDMVKKHEKDRRRMLARQNRTRAARARGYRQESPRTADGSEGV